MKEVMSLSTVIAAISMGLAATSSFADTQAAAPSGTGVHEDVYMEDEDSGAKCKVRPITDKIEADVGEVVQWNLFHRCSTERDIAISFMDKIPCTEPSADLTKKMSSHSTNFIRCTISTGAGTADNPKKYKFSLKGPANEIDPEIDVPRPKMGHRDLVAILGALTFVLEVALGVVLVVLVVQFNRLKRALHPRT